MKEFTRVDKKAKIKWSLSRLGGLILLGIVAAIAIPSVNELWCTICCIAALALQLINMIVYPIIEYIQWEYLIDDDRIEIKKGIFWRSHTVVPISRIQHVSYKSGPLQNIFGLASVEIHTAGGVQTIEEVSKDTAKKICELLKNIVNLKVAEKRYAELIAQKAEVKTDA